MKSNCSLFFHYPLYKHALSIKPYVPPPAAAVAEQPAEATDAAIPPAEAMDAAVAPAEATTDAPQNP